MVQPVLNVEKSTATDWKLSPVLRALCSPTTDLKDRHGQVFCQEERCCCLNPKRHREAQSTSATGAVWHQGSLHIAFSMHGHTHCSSKIKRQEQGLLRVEVAEMSEGAAGQQFSRDAAQQSIRYRAPIHRVCSLSLLHSTENQLSFTSKRDHRMAKLTFQV